jgi:hypothetical protein
MAQEIDGQKKYSITQQYKIQNTKYKTYSENDDEQININYIKHFQQNNKGRGIIGILVHSLKSKTTTRPISPNIKSFIKIQSCVVCGSNSDIICDHKNDMYNDERVLNIFTQKLEDFQPLCNHCNLQKRQIFKMEEQTGQVFSAKNIQRYKCYLFEFPWEKKVFDKNDINCKNGTYWFDPVEFDKNIYYYSVGVIPIINEIKYKIKTNKLKLTA